MAETSKVSVKVNIPGEAAEQAKKTTPEKAEKPSVLVKTKQVGISFAAEIVSESGFINPDGFSSIRFRNIGADNAKVLDVIPLDPTDPELNLSNDYYCKITDKIRVTFAGVSSDKQILVIKIYQNEL